MERAPEDIIRDKLDGHVGFDVSEMLRHGSLIRKHPGDKNINTSDYDKAKKIIEHDCIEKRKQDVQNILVDVMALRQMELLDKEAMPMPKLVDAVIKALPTKIEAETKHTFSFAEMIQKAQAPTDFSDTIDVESIKGMDD